MKKLLLALLFIFFASNVEAANRYWVGGGASTNWNATGNTNWSASSGGANNASVPTTGDSVFFDGNSGSGTSNISASITVANVDFTGYTGTLTQANSTTLTINSASSAVLTFSSGMTYSASNATQAISFTGSNDLVVTSAGHTIGNFTINGTGSVYLSDALTTRADATLTLTAGNFDASGFAVTFGFFSSSNSNTRSITMGGGTWTGNGGCANSTIWTTNTTTNLSFAKDTSNLVFQFCSGFQGLRTFASGGLTFNDVTFNSTAVSPVLLTVSGAPTFTNATFYGPLALIAATTGNSTFSIATQFYFDSTAGGFTFVGQGSTSQYMSFNQASGTISIDKASLYDTRWNQAGSPTVTATNSYDLGGNVGVTITAPGGGGASGGYIIGGN